MKRITILEGSTEWVTGAFVTREDTEKLSLEAIGLMTRVLHKVEGEIIHASDYSNNLEIIGVFSELKDKGYIIMIDMFTYKLVKR